MENIYQNDSEPTYRNIIETFIHLIGYISMILNFKTYSKAFEEYKIIILKITEWATNYELNRNLTFIDQNEILEMYKKLNNLQTEFSCNDLMGSESELADYAVNWMWHLIILRKNYILKKEENNGK